MSRREKERRDIIPEGHDFERRRALDRRYGLRKRAGNRPSDEDRNKLIRDQKERKEVEK